MNSVISERQTRSGPNNTQMSATDPGGEAVSSRGLPRVPFPASAHPAFLCDLSAALRWPFFSPCSGSPSCLGPSQGNDFQGHLIEIMTLVTITVGIVHLVRLVLFWGLYMYELVNCHHSPVKWDAVGHPLAVPYLAE